MFEMSEPEDCQSGRPQPATWLEYPDYAGDDLGINYSPKRLHFRIWSPPAQEVIFRIYQRGCGDNLLQSYPMKRDIDGTWVLLLDGDWNGHYYTVQSKIGNCWSKEVPDPYAVAVGVNGERGLILDMSTTNPAGWENDSVPGMNDPGDIVVWEIHVRDFSIHPSAGNRYPGKFLAFTETGTKSLEGFSTCLDHLKELKITHVHLLPVFDFQTVDESRPDELQYNWGYDPKNFNALEGSYASDPFDGSVRIREFKSMVQALHQSGIRIIMDVAFNHMYDAAQSPFEQLAPGYFFRMNTDGSYSNGSGCGNETASERRMMRRFMIQSLLHWAREYHIDGFRFDLMGLHDVETMNAISKALNELAPNTLLYGEGWIAADSPLPPNQRAVKENVSLLNGIAVFSDDIRDAIRGQWHDGQDNGFVAGAVGMKESIHFGVVASTRHPQIDYSRLRYSKVPYSDSPMKTVTYVSCHDNPCLWDLIASSCKECNHAERVDIQKLANAIVLTSQGIPFLHAGEEMARTKFGEHNTYNLPDTINQLVWSRKALYYDIFAFYRDMIALRRKHPAFRMPTSEMISEHLRFLNTYHELVVGFHLHGHANGDPSKDILVYYNSSSYRQKVDLPAGDYIAIANKYQVNDNGLKIPGYDQVIRNSAVIPSRSVLVLRSIDFQDHLPLEM